MLSLALALILGRDLEFERIQVEWIAQSGTVKNLDQVIPRHEAALLRLLDDDRYIVRKLAADSLVAGGREASLALAWGERVKERQIAETATKLRSLLYVCQHCLGDGYCPACNRPKQFEGADRPVRQPTDWGTECDERCGWGGLCVACGGSGDIRYVLEWNDEAWGVEWLPGHQGKIPVERDLFSAKVDELIKRAPRVPRDVGAEDER